MGVSSVQKVSSIQWTSPETKSTAKIAKSTSRMILIALLTSRWPWLTEWPKKNRDADERESHQKGWRVGYSLVQTGWTAQNWKFNDDGRSGHGQTTWNSSQYSHVRLR